MYVYKSIFKIIILSIGVFLLYISCNNIELNILDILGKDVYATETDQSSTSTDKPTDQSSKKTQNSSSKVSTDMANLLARLIYAEARGENYTGQVAVGAVVLNRVESSQFPNTIAGVIYQKGQFSSVTDGQINLSVPKDSSAYKAAKEAINGSDPTNRSTLFL
jgi:spore germination cell wall hydrolase CwlJ-like protein